MLRKLIASKLKPVVFAPLGQPSVRCLNKYQAAQYLGIGITLLAALDVPSIRFGRRIVYDVLDLNKWLDDFKERVRADTPPWGEKDLTNPIEVDPDSKRYGVPGNTEREYRRLLGLGFKEKRKP